MSEERQPFDLGRIYSKIWSEVEKFGERYKITDEEWLSIMNTVHKEIVGALEDRIKNASR